MVGAKPTRTRPAPAGARLVSAVLETASSPSSTTRAASKTALKAGSSQHGKARRASVDWNWVAAMVRVRPASSV